MDRSEVCIRAKEQHFFSQPNANTSPFSWRSYLRQPQTRETTTQPRVTDHFDKGVDKVFQRANMSLSKKQQGSKAVNTR